VTREEFVRLRKKTLRLTQVALATRLGVDPMTVSRWERGVRKIPEPAARLLLVLAGKGGSRKRQ
jgi:DNA-binding transcriptional regulator YiaG